jgi:cell division protein ZapE
MEIISQSSHNQAKEAFLRLIQSPVRPEDILSSLRPPEHFAHATLENYIPESRFPSQAQAGELIKEFVKEEKKGFFESLFGKSKSDSKQGLYLDGGFGVGKTHLLASAYHAFSGNKAYLSFQELMFLVGLESLNKTVEWLKDYQLLIIDEFELDDPANTRISSTLLTKLFAEGVKIITSSNTPPGALGEGKFSVEDFKRELGDLVSNFTLHRVDGEDYRITHRASNSEVRSWTNDYKLFQDLLRSLESLKDPARILDLTLPNLLHILSLAHPIRVRKAMEAFDAIVLREADQIFTPHEALRFVYFIDKAYDNNTFLVASSPIYPSSLFHNSYFNGGDTKKYRRAVSRLGEMSLASYQHLYS